MNRFVPFLLVLCLPVPVGCDVEDLELETDGADTVESMSGSGLDGSSTDDPSGSTGAPSGTDLLPYSDPFSDPQAWANAMAAARCDALFRCGCVATGAYPDVATCTEDLSTFYVERAWWAENSGAALELECLQLQVETMFEGACEDTVPPASPSSAGEAQFCPLFQGSHGVGEACTPSPQPFARDTECAEGLACIDGVCGVRPSQGEACGVEGGLSLACTGSLRCIDGVCTPRSGLGEACGQFQCEDGLACEDGACAPVRDTGEPCDSGSQCGSQICRDDVCAPPASVLCGPYASELLE